MKKKYPILITILSLLILTACGASKENIEAASSSMEALTAQKQLTEEIYDQLTADFYAQNLSDLSTEYEAYNNTDFNKLNNKEILALIPEMDALTESYKSLYDEMNSELKSSADAAAEASKHLEILCYIKNSSGSELSSIIFKDVSQNTDTGNLLSEGVTLPSGRILAGVTLPVHADSSEYSLVATDTLGNETTYSLSIADMNSAVETGISITLGSPENGAEVGTYAVN